MKTKKNRPVALLTTDDLHGHVTDDELLVEPLAALGRTAEFVSWRAAVDWRDYAGVVIRSPWDYTEAAEQFVATLGAIAAAGIPLANSLSLVRWNLDKRYLSELEGRGVPVVPTLWLEDLTQSAIDRAFAAFSCRELVLKPVLGASARDTFRMTPGSVEQTTLGCFSERPCMLQPFLPEIVSEGEHSLFYFAGALSHVVRKRPAEGDFRVQEEHGGQLEAVAAGAPMTTFADRVLAQLDESPLYARVDLVETQGGIRLMELELVEPSLYLRLSDGAPARLASAIDRWLSADEGPRHR
ncbi:MAG: hypothetical protein AAF552_08030 [Pseudomonadota bacterium]